MWKFVVELFIAKINLKTNRIEREFESVKKIIQHKPKEYY